MPKIIACAGRRCKTGVYVSANSLPAGQAKCHRCRNRDARERETARIKYYDEGGREAKREYRIMNADEINSQTRKRYHDNNIQQRERAANYRCRNRDYKNSADIQRRRAKAAEIPTPRAWTRWSAAEDATVKRDDVTLTEICYMLGRSYWAVMTRRQKLRNTNQIGE